MRPLRQGGQATPEFDRICEDIQGRLARWERAPVTDDPGTRRAAVAIALFPAAPASFVMIKRAPRWSNPGQWALPGGRVDDSETLVDTALRELEEETAITAASTDVLGCLDDFRASRGIVITPVVVRIRGRQDPRRNPAEVASLHPIPLARLTAPGVPRWRTDSDGTRLLQMPLRHDMIVHAPTGAILWQFAEVALRGQPRRVTDLAEPDFTRS